jgi:hypothetical protein
MSPASDRSPAPPHGVVACTLRGRRSSDGFEMFVERDGSINLVLLDVRAARDQEALRDQLAARARASLSAREPMHTLTGSLRKIVCEAVAASVGVIALRVCLRDERVELLNAGMPAVACVLPDGRQLQFPALSPDIGPRMDKAHPYELMPLTLGSRWFLASDGATEGLEDSSNFWAALGLPAVARDLADETPQGLANRMRLVLGNTLSEDASLVVVPSSPPPRFESGIV